MSIASAGTLQTCNSGGKHLSISCKATYPFRDGSHHDPRIVQVEGFDQSSNRKAEFFTYNEMLYMFFVDDFRIKTKTTVYEENSIL